MQLTDCILVGNWTLKSAPMVKNIKELLQSCVRTKDLPSNTWFGNPPLQCATGPPAPRREENPPPPPRRVSWKLMKVARNNNVFSDSSSECIRFQNVRSESSNCHKNWPGNQLGTDSILLCQHCRMSAPRVIILRSCGPKTSRGVGEAWKLRQRLRNIVFCFLQYFNDHFFDPSGEYIRLFFPIVCQLIWIIYTWTEQDVH